MPRCPIRSGSTVLLLATLALVGLTAGCEQSNAENPQAEASNASGHGESKSGHDEGSDHAHGEGEHEGPHLAPMMGEIQRYSQKLGYAIRGKNQPLADFYMHEIDAVLTEIEVEVPVYAGVAIPKYVRALMRPSVEPVKQAIDAGNWDKAQQRYETMIASCNACHNATNFGFIKITPASGEPPYNQEF